MSRIALPIQGPETDALVDAIIEGASLMKTTNPFKADPIFHYVDVTALETLLDHADRTESDLVVKFTAEDLVFVIDGDETLIVSDRTQELDPWPPGT